MALVTLRSNLCRLCDFRTRTSLATLKHWPLRPAHRLVRAHLCWWGSSLQPAPSRASSPLASGQHFHSEWGNVSPRTHDGDRPEENPDEQTWCRRLRDLSSSADVLTLVSSLDPLPDAVAVLALQRIREVEKGDSSGRLRGETLESPIFKALCFQLEQQSPHLTNVGLATVLQTLSMLPADPPSSLLLTLMAECQRRLQEGGLAVHELCVLGESLVLLPGPGHRLLELVTGHLQREELGRFSPEDIVALYRILQACPEMVDQSQGFLSRLNSFTVSLVSRLSPGSMSQVLSALVALDQAQALPLVIKLGRYVGRHIPHFTSQELGAVMDALMYFGHHDRFLTKALEQHVATQCVTLNSEALSKVTAYCSKKRVLSKPILNTVAETFVCQAETLAPHQILELVEPFGQLNYLPPNAPAFFRKLESTLAAHCMKFPPKMLLRLLHSCSLLERHPINFMGKIFSPHFLHQLQGDEPYLDRLSLAQLTQLFLTSILECPFYKGPRLLPKYQVRSFLTPCCSLESPVDFLLYRAVMTALIDLLGARLYFASRVLTPYCYTIDVEIKLDEDGFVLPFTVHEDVHKRVALCIDGPKRFCFNSKNLLGQEATKQRHLRLLGYEVVQIPYHEVEMLKSRLELLEYLQSKLFSQSPGLRW
ncbi:PREDICTED: FAST kinase domain-containing protein 3 [Chrysochloris asiatica]|uniref:FAST kinase domain-containing protein 3 n=1 Tax=Chrysochloris asiatica TaxID=185453 RepID=A0A9B0U376_CHRAS|nr:PREDICTED: FAST kinase domain-containing protein 3 [Chrysochloris asiatica]